MARKDYFDFIDDFTGVRLFAQDAIETAGRWYVNEVASSGTPTYTQVDNEASANGALSVAFDTQAEAQNLSLSQNDILQWDIDLIHEVEFVLKLNQATLDSTSSIAFGVIGDRADAIDSIAQAAIFRVIGTSANVVVESDDGTNNNDDIATGTTLAAAYKHFKISFTEGTNDVRFFVDGVPVGTATTFDMSNYTGALQLFVQIQKTSDANADGFTISFARVRGRSGLAA